MYAFECSDIVLFISNQLWNINLYIRYRNKEHIYKKKV